MGQNVNKDFSVAMIEIQTIINPAGSQSAGLVDRIRGLLDRVKSTLPAGRCACFAFLCNNRIELFSALISLFVVLVACLIEGFVFAVLMACTC